MSETNPSSPVEEPKRDGAQSTEAAFDVPDPARALPEPGPSDKVKSGTLYCPQCGERMAAVDRFCNACGWDAENPEIPPPGASPAPPESPRDLGPISSFNRTTVLLLCLLLGFLGVHRFYVGKTATGILWVVTLSFLGIGWIYDLVLVATGEFRDAEERRVWHWQ